MSEKAIRTLKPSESYGLLVRRTRTRLAAWAEADGPAADTPRSVAARSPSHSSIFYFWKGVTFIKVNSFINDTCLKSQTQSAPRTTTEGLRCSGDPTAAGGMAGGWGGGNGAGGAGGLQEAWGCVSLVATRPPACRGVPTGTQMQRHGKKVPLRDSFKRHFISRPGKTQEEMTL